MMQYNQINECDAQCKSISNNLARANAISRILMTLLFTWTSIQNFPGFTPSKLSTNVSDWIEFGLLVALCTTFALIMHFINESLKKIDSENEYQRKSLKWNVVGIAAAFLATSLFLLNMKISVVASDTNQIFTVVAPLLFIFAIGCFIVGRYFSHKHKDNRIIIEDDVSQKQNKFNCIPNIFYDDRFILTMMLVGFGAFLGEGLMNFSYTSCNNFSGSNWLFLVMLVFAGFFSGLLLIKDIRNDKNDGVIFIPKRINCLGN